MNQPSNNIYLDGKLMPSKTCRDFHSQVITLTTGQSFDLSHCVHSEPAAVLLGPRIGLNGNVLDGEGECIVAGRGRLGVTSPSGAPGFTCSSSL